MVLAFNLAHVQLTGKCCYVGVRRFDTGIKEVRLGGKLFLGRDDVPRLELLDHCWNVLVFVTNVVFL